MYHFSGGTISNNPQRKVQWQRYIIMIMCATDVLFFFGYFELRPRKVIQKSWSSVGTKPSLKDDIFLSTYLITHMKIIVCNIQVSRLNNMDLTYILHGCHTCQIYLKCMLLMYYLNAWYDTCGMWHVYSLHRTCVRITYLCICDIYFFSCPAFPDDFPDVYFPYM